MHRDICLLHTILFAAVSTVLPVSCLLQFVYNNCGLLCGLYVDY